MIFIFLALGFASGMSRKRLPRIRAVRPRALAETAAIGSMSAAEALSFLRETRGLSEWTAGDMAKSLKISVSDANHVLAILELQGYVKSAGAEHWLTTSAGEQVCGSQTPRHTHESVEQALSDLRGRIALVNRASKASYRITEAVAFGDFLRHQGRVQPAEVGIQLMRRTPDNASLESAQEHEPERVFLKRLEGRGSLVRLRPYEGWMSERTHRDLL